MLAFFSSGDRYSKKQSKVELHNPTGDASELESNVKQQNYYYCTIIMPLKSFRKFQKIIIIDTKKKRKTRKVHTVSADDLQLPFKTRHARLCVLVLVVFLISRLDLVDCFVKRLVAAREKV